MTIELQDALVTEEGRPVLLRVRLCDIERQRKDGFVATFSMPAFSQDVCFRLGCSREAAEALLEIYEEEPMAVLMIHEFAIVDMIDEVSRAVFELKVLRSDDDAEQHGLAIGTPVAFGTLIDFVFVEAH